MPPEQEECDKTIYDIHCKGEFTKIINLIECMDRKLFKGNGGEPLNVLIDRNTRFRKVISWIAGAVFMIVILGSLAWIIKVRVIGQ